MQKLGLLFSLALAVWTGPLASGQSWAADLSTPEGAIAAYIEGVAEQEFSAILAASAVENMSKGYNIVAHVDRLKALTPRIPMPSSDPLFIEINKIDFTGTIAGNVKFLAYGLMSTSGIVEGKSVKMDATGAAEFASAVRGDRLSGLELVKVAIPSPKILNSERYQVLAALAAKMYGADASTERVALLSFEGLHFAMGFSLLQYGDEWGVRDQTAPTAGFGGFGDLKRVTPGQFEELLK